MGKNSKYTSAQMEHFMEKHYSKEENETLLNHFAAELEKLSRQVDMFAVQLPGGLKVSRNDETFSFLYVSEELCNMLGYTYEEFMEYSGGSATGACYPPDLPKSLGACLACFEKGDTYQCEYRIRKKDQSLVWVVDYGKKYCNENGTIFINSFIADISERKQKMQEIEAILDSLPDGLVKFILDEEFHFLEWNDRFCQQIGYHPEKDKTGFLSYLFEPDQKMVRNCLLEKQETEDVVEISYRCLDSMRKIRWHRARCRKIGEKQGYPYFLALISDITEEKIAQFKWNAEQEKYRLAMKNTPDILFEYDIVMDEFRSYSNFGKENQKEKIEICMKEYSRIISSPQTNTILHPEDVGTVISVLKKGEFSHQMVRIRFPNDLLGTYRWCVVQGTAVYDQGVPIRVIGTIRDISQEKEQEADNKRLQEICYFTIHNDYDAICLVDVTTQDYSLFTELDFLNITKTGGNYTTQLEEDALLFTKQENRDSFLELFSLPKILKRLEKGNTEHQTHHFCSRVTKRWKELKCVYFREDKTKILMSIRDVHDDIIKQRMEKEKEEQTKQLLMEALKTAEHASLAKSDFLSHMSHEIRTPLNAIAGLAALASKQDDISNKIKDYMEKIMFSSNHLISLVNDILDMAKIESGKLELNQKAFLLEEVIHEVTGIIYSQTIKKEQKFEVITKIKHENLIGDSLRLNQILLNILYNAVKYTPSKGTITMEIIEQQNQFSNSIEYCFRIQDTGIGMKKEFLERLFEPFEQAKQNTGGTGLGMTITKSLVCLMNGKIQVESQEEKGSVFSVFLPFCINSEGENTFLLNSGIEKQNMLVMEENEEDLQKIIGMLDKMGMTIQPVRSMQEALEKIKVEKEFQKGYDFFLFDWENLKKEGVDWLEQLKKEKGNKLKLILMSPYQKVDIEKEPGLGNVDEFLSKPIFQSSLYNLLLSTATTIGKKQNKNIWNEKPFRGKRFLLAEDNELNQEIAVEFLKATGAQVETAWNGKEAVDKFCISKYGWYDCILMDIQMPELNGYEAADRIRKSNHKDAEKIPIVAMTANAFSEDVAQALQSGMNGHIAKPIHIDVLIQTLKKIDLGGEKDENRRSYGKNAH